jgi:pyrimidine-specific ribonucleoside hydrolase
MKFYKLAFIILLLSFLSVQFTFSHYKARYHVIIDTDGGIDDFRAICMILANPEIEVIAIVTTDGVLAPDDTGQRLINLLHSFGHEGIPVARGRAFLENPPECRAFAGSLPWGQKGTLVIKRGLSAVELINQAALLEEMPVDYIALGPLTNLAEALDSNSGLLKEIRKIYWYDEGYSAHGFNYNLNPGAADKIMNSSLNTDIIDAGKTPLKIDERFISALDTISSDYARAILDLYKNEGQALEEHFMGLSLADDCIPLYLAFPEQFSREVVQVEKGIVVIRPVPGPDFQSFMLTILDSDKEDKSILFKSFPLFPGLFEDDVSPYVEQIIRRHGLKEWKIVVLTNEFHEHLGIYSIVGAKMGLRAREYFRVGIDELIIKSFAGDTPPVSCLNDGLQVSTGATLGHGTIVVDDSDPVPAVLFTFKNITIRIDVKQGIKAQIRNDVQSAVKLHGVDTPEYWQAIRELAIQYWYELDRKEIFEIKVVQ